MKKIILGIAILLLVVGIVPVHEFGHFLMAKIVNLDENIIDITWFSFNRVTDERGEYFLSGIDFENISFNWRWTLVILGGFFQGLLYAAIGFFLSFRKEKTLRIFSLVFLILGAIGLFLSIYELREVQRAIYAGLFLIITLDS